MSSLQYELPYGSLRHLYLYANLLSHTAHPNAFSSVCVTICCFRLLANANNLSSTYVYFTVECSLSWKCHHTTLRNTGTSSLLYVLPYIYIYILKPLAQSNDLSRSWPLNALSPVCVTICQQVTSLCNGQSLVFVHVYKICHTINNDLHHL